MQSLFMRKLILSLIVVMLIVSIGGYYLYRNHFTDMIAQAVVAESLPAYMPKRMQKRIQAIGEPINKGAEAILQEMQASDIPMEEMLSVIDNTTEEQAYNLLDELNSREPKSVNEVFSIAKKHISADFDIEIFRQPFNEHLNMKQIQKGLRHANQNRKMQALDFTTAKIILRKILLEKEQEIKESTR